MKASARKLHTLPQELCEGLSIGWIGPALHEGLLPAIFYFALSFEDSLLTPPYQTPVEELLKKSGSIRIFSVTLPFHHYGSSEQTTVSKWMEALENNAHAFDAFFDSLQKVIHNLSSWSLNWSFIGLSRGAWIGAWLVAKLDDTSIPLLLFAPMTRLTSPSLASFDLHNLPLAKHPVWMSVGHADTRINTRDVIRMMEGLCNSKAHVPMQHQLVIYPSIGYKGHGTPAEIFCQGIQWLSEQRSLHTQAMSLPAC